MKVPHIHGVNDVRLDEIEVPHAGPRDVVLRVATVGICGSDLAAVARGSIYGEFTRPVPLGHELSGIVAELGSEVAGYKVGDRVIVNPLHNMIGNGGPEGGFGECLLVRDVVSQPGSLLRIPDTLSLERAALVEPLAVSLHAVNLAVPKAGETAAVFGAGPIGLGSVLWLRNRGIENIVVFDLSAFRRGRALEFGASAAFDPREHAPAQVLAELHGVEPMWGMPMPATNIFIEASGAPNVIPEIIGYCGHSKRLIVVGGQKNPVPVDFTLLMAKELTVRGSLGYPNEFPAVIDLLSRSDIDIEPFVSHRFDAADFLAALQVAAKPDQAAKVLVTYAPA